MYVTNYNISVIPKHPPDNSSLIAMVGRGFAMIAIDTNIASPPKPHKHRQNKLFQLTDGTVFASTGCTCYTLPFIQTARNYLDEVLPLCADTTMRKVKTAEIICRMTTGRGRRFPYISNALISFNNGYGSISGFASTGCVARGTSYYIAGYADRYLQTLFSPLVGIGSCDIKFAQEFITNCFLQAANDFQNCKNTLHLGILTQNGIKIVEEVLK